jgi:23S rRNA (pseudouridine1915-N3)-methyltransferase
MRFELVFVGKTTEKYLAEGLDIYIKKLKYYMPSDIIIVHSKTSSVDNEAEIILKGITSKDFVILLDEKGKKLDSVMLSKEIQKWMNQSYKKIVFITGGAYGVNMHVRKRADFIWSLSDLTFTHQMIRLLLSEQLYRAMTILKGESYHH